ncbi:MAG: hypothetical protein ACOCXQ_02430 [Patescibacteria group bacterium]
MDNQNPRNQTMPPMPNQGQSVPQAPQIAQQVQQPQTSQVPQQPQVQQANTPAETQTPGAPASQEPPNGGFGQSAVTINPQQEPSKKPSIKLIAIGGVLLLVVIIIGGLALVRNQEQAETAATAENQSPDIAEEMPNAMQERPIPTLDPSMAAVTFASSNGNNQATVGEETSIQIKADSLGADVNGYDMLIPYDTAAFEIVEAVSLQDAFQIYQFDRGDYYAITGIKLLNVTDPTVFEDTEIIELRIIPKRAGNLYLEVMEERGKETSKMVDNEVRIIKPQFQPIKLEIQ